MYAELQWNRAGEHRCWLVIYRSRAKAMRDPADSLLRIEVSNAQMTELVVANKIKPRDMDGAYA